MTLKGKRLMADSEKHFLKSGKSRKSSLAERFDKGGLEDFSAEEVLELILEFSCTDGCKRTARELTEKFGSLGRVLKADPSELRRTGGLDDRSAMLIRLIPEAIGLYNSEKTEKRECLRVKALTKVFSPCFIGAGEEKFMLACFDERLKLMSLSDVSSGTGVSTGAGFRKIINTLVSDNCPLAALAHNHPYSGSKPSDEDICVTRELSRAMNHIGVYLMDHIIIGDDGCYSMRSHGELNIFD